MYGGCYPRCMAVAIQDVWRLLSNIYGDCYLIYMAVAIKQIKNSDIHICIFKILIFKHLQRSKNRYSVSI